MKNRLKEIRLNRKLTLKALAKASGVGLSTIGNFENGQTNCSPDIIERLARTLGLPVSAILDEETADLNAQRQSKALPPTDARASARLLDLVLSVQERRYPEMVNRIESLTGMIAQLAKPGEASERDLEAALVAAQLLSEELQRRLGSVKRHGSNQAKIGGLNLISPSEAAKAAELAETVAPENLPKSSRSHRAGAPSGDKGGPSPGVSPGSKGKLTPPR